MAYTILVASLVLLALTAESFQQVPASCSQPTIQVNYSIEYSDANCSTAANPPEITVTLIQNEKVITLMELASNVDPPTYRFTATYFGTTGLATGYFLNGLNGMTPNFTESECFWAFLVERPDGEIVAPNVGISDFSIPSNGYRVIFRLTQTFSTLVPLNDLEMEAIETYNSCQDTIDAQVSGTIPESCIQPGIQVGYSIQYFDAVCSDDPDPSNQTILLRQNERIITLMELAVDIDSAYRFQATYFGSFLGYFINAINGTAPNFTENSCFWSIFIQRPDGEIIASPVGVSSFSVPSAGYSIIFRLISSPTGTNSTDLNSAEMAAIETFVECQSALESDAPTMPTESDAPTILTGGSPAITAGLMLTVLLPMLVLKLMVGP